MLAISLIMIYVLCGALDRILLFLVMIPHVSEHFKPQKMQKDLKCWSRGEVKPYVEVFSLVYNKWKNKEKDFKK